MITIDGEFGLINRLDGDMSLTSQIDGEYGVVFPIDIDHEHYTGAYTVDPKFESQTLLTNQKIMDDDVTVNAIEVHRTGNPYGTTVYIGGLING